MNMSVEGCLHWRTFANKPRVLWDFVTRWERVSSRQHISLGWSGFTLLADTSIVASCYCKGKKCTDYFPTDCRPPKCIQSTWSLKGFEYLIHNEPQQVLQKSALTTIESVHFIPEVSRNSSPHFPSKRSGCGSHLAFRSCFQKHWPSARPSHHRAVQFQATTKFNKSLPLTKCVSIQKRHLQSVVYPIHGHHRLPSRLLLKFQEAVRVTRNWFGSRCLEKACWVLPRWVGAFCMQVSVFLTIKIVQCSVNK